VLAGIAVAAGLLAHRRKKERKNFLDSGASFEI
jgi:hypothetical protein